MKLLVTSIVALTACLAFAGVASAAPSGNNPNTQTLPVTCDGLGSFGLFKPDSSAAGFLPDGDVVVVKNFVGEATFVATTLVDGQVWGPVNDSFGRGGNGKGYHDRVIECTFSETFTDTFTLDAETAEVFEIPASYVGTQVRVDGTATGPLSLIHPGSH